MFSIAKLTLCTALFAIGFAASAEAQQINTPHSANAGITAKIARVRSMGNSYADSWKNTTNTNCSNIDIGSTVTNPSNAVPSTTVPGTAPSYLTPGTVPSTIVQDPRQVTVVTGNITNVCFARGQ